jgi:hypothetical protein
MRRRNPEGRHDLVLLFDLIGYIHNVYTLDSPLKKQKKLGRGGGWDYKKGRRRL